MDFGNDKKAYVKAFFNNINWNVVSKRYHKAKEIYNLMCD
jgi:superoxide dismutase